MSSWAKHAKNRRKKGNRNQHNRATKIVNLTKINTNTNKKQSISQASPSPISVFSATSLPITPASTTLSLDNIVTLRRATESSESFDTNPELHRDSVYNRICDRIPIIQPFGPFKMIWDSIVIILLLYTSIEVPFTLTFDVELTLNTFPGILALIVDCFLLCDIILTFRTGYVDKYDHLHIITTPKSIARKYIRGWFFIDLISSLPLEVTVAPLLNDVEPEADFGEFLFLRGLRVFRLLRGLKMLRLFRILKLLQRFARYVFVRETAMILKVARVLGAMLITAHYFACFWYLVGEHTYRNGKDSWIQIIKDQHGDNATDFTKYSYSWYWSIVTLFTTGYGDISAHNEEEQWAASACVLVGTCFFAYFIGVLTTLLEEGNRVRMYELEKVEEAQLFCSHYKLPRDLARAIVTHIRYHCNYNYVFDKERILNALPAHLQNSITTHLSTSLRDLDLFSHLTPDIIGQIVLKMTSTSCNAGHKLFRKGQLSHEFYIQRTGKSKLMLSKDSAILERGHVCGEYTMLSGKHRATLHCLTWSEFYVLNINDLLAVLHDNYIDPKIVGKQFKIIKKCLKLTSQKWKPRKVKFKHDSPDLNTVDFVHEFSPHATKSTIPSPSASMANLKGIGIAPKDRFKDDDKSHKTDNTQYLIQQALSKSFNIKPQRINSDAASTTNTNLTPTRIRTRTSDDISTIFGRKDTITNLTGHGTPDSNKSKSNDNIFDETSKPNGSSNRLIRTFSKLLFRESSITRHDKVVRRHPSFIPKTSDERELEYSGDDDVELYSSDDVGHVGGDGQLSFHPNTIRIDDIDGNNNQENSNNKYTHINNIFFGDNVDDIDELKQDEWIENMSKTMKTKHRNSLLNNELTEVTKERIIELQEKHKNALKKLDENNELLLFYYNRLNNLTIDNNKGNKSGSNVNENSNKNENENNENNDNQNEIEIEIEIIKNTAEIDKDENNFSDKEHEEQFHE